MTTVKNIQNRGWGRIKAMWPRHKRITIYY
jgi:hypothetical protein